MKKTILLSLTLAASLLHAEDNGFFVSAGYQIGEASQKVKNTGDLKRLSDTYENLNSLLNTYKALTSAVTTANSSAAINNAINSLNASARGLVEKGGSPAYQATLLALKATVGLWNSIGYAVICGGYTTTPNNTTTEIFKNQPGKSSTTKECGGNVGTLKAEKNNSLSIEQFKQINQAYQILQAALKKGLPALSNTTTTVEVTIKTATNAKNINVNNDNNNAADTTIETKNTYINDAQNLLTQAQTIINTLQNNCPQLTSTSTTNTNEAAPSWQTGQIQNSCTLFGKQFSAINDMINNAKEIVNQSKNINTTPQTPADFNIYRDYNKPESTKFAQTMLASARAQAEILSLANQVANHFNTVSSSVLGKYIGECAGSPGNVTNATWGRGCAGVSETLNALKNNNASFDQQVEQIKQTRLLANTIVDFKGTINTLRDTYATISKTAQNTLKESFLKNLVSTSENKNYPVGLQTQYHLNQNSYNQFLDATKQLDSNPFRNVGMISSQANNGTMNGVGFQIGYKQFFGENRRWGLRYYGFFDYNHTYIKSNFFNSTSDVFTYGVGSDLLVNFINEKDTNFLGKNNRLSMGVFGGIALGGTSWINSEYVNLATINNVYNAKVSVANFQFLINLGLRMNLAKEKKDNHAIQHGIELGVKIPTINTKYYSFMGATLEYRRLYSVYLNYVFAY
ncbi:outer membrane beta-barrel protein [Helicobacter pylori]|uniref:Hop family adhesin SabA n=1 Tax=Helicobacter pylori TaxID=210 RepID=UPI00165AC9F9|nr:SabA family sialic acid-binding adhesin [Helicobacter pylori]WQS21458.1 outer membrane beta-barrel protein [Helicobacter pylori]WQS30802.1 outer membrane beta-barrel protein [Helicobacter pylori]